jgi:hypothetical protein
MDLKNIWVHVVGEQIGAQFHDNFTVVCQNDSKGFLAASKESQERLSSFDERSQKMKTKLFLTILVIIALVAPFAWNTGKASAASGCDSVYVTQTGKTFEVKPTGVDDTANLQCAFDKAIAVGAGARVQLSSGTFHTAQIVVYGFEGMFTGNGAKNTVIINLPNLYVTAVDAFFNPPSAANPWPNLFSFVDGDFAITDLAINIVGDDLTTGWTNHGIDPPLEELGNAIMISGTHANVRVERFLLEGETMPGGVFGYNVINGIYYEGTIGKVPPPISGSYILKDSTIRTITFGTPVFNLLNASVVVSGNRYEDTLLAMDAADVQYSTLEFSNNRATDAFLGFDLWNFYAAEDVGSEFTIRNNELNSFYGIIFEQTFGAGNTCLIKGNNVQNATDLGIYLGPGTTGCTVVGGSNKTNVLDLGVGNNLVGVDNMGTGVGPSISHFLTKK